VCNSYADGGVVATDDAEEDRKQALRIAEEEINPLAFEGIASNVFDQVPADWLLKHGIKRVVVGHKPTGDCPAVLSSAYTGVEVVSVDTSFARRRDITDKMSNRFGENRGDAMSVVEIAGSDSHNNCLEVFGTLSDGTEYFNTHPHIGNNKGAKNGDSNLGKRTVDKWWIKVSIAPGLYHMCRGSGRNVEYITHSEEEVMRRMDHQLLKSSQNKYS
jgi:hypothetical protein